MHTTVQRVSLPKGRRVLAVSDIHGHGHLLERLLTQAAYRPGEDVLVIVGDLLEKGPQSLATLRLAMRLAQREHVYVLQGNVDVFRVQRLVSDDPAMQKELVEHTMMFRRWWGSTWLDEMCREVGVALTEETDTRALFPRLRARFSQEISFLQQLPTMLETETIIFVHGGIPHERLEELKDTDCFLYLKRDHFLEEGLSFQKYVVVGHWPTALCSSKRAWFNPLIDHDRHIIAIDGGCGVKTDGQLNLLILPDGQAERASYIVAHDLPMALALDAQEASSDSYFIHWGDHWVELVERGAEVSRVLHQGTERIVPTAYLYESKGRLCCEDVTTALLDIHPGDEMGIITSLSDRCYVKKNGVHGWYFGKYTNKETEP